MTTEAAVSLDEKDQPKDLRDLLWNMARTILSKDFKEFSSGDVVELRRLDPDQFPSPAFWKLRVKFLDGKELYWLGGTDQDEAEKRWTVVFSTIARAGEYRTDAPLGRALANAGFHEQRFIRLLRARGDRLLDEISAAVRFLVVKGEPFSVHDVAGLIATGDRSDAETYRRNVARSYYSALMNKDRQENEDNK